MKKLKEADWIELVEGPYQPHCIKCRHMICTCNMPPLEPVYMCWFCDLRVNANRIHQGCTVKLRAAMRKSTRLGGHASWEVQQAVVCVCCVEKYGEYLAGVVAKERKGQLNLV
jgi:hypothetical protein